MIYEGNLKSLHEKSEGNNGSPWNLVDVGDLIWNVSYKCGRVKEILIPNGKFWPNFFEDALRVYVAPPGQISWFFEAIYVLLIFYSKSLKMQLNP